MSFFFSQSYVSEYLLENGYYMEDSYISVKEKISFKDIHGYRFSLSLNSLKTSVKSGASPHIVGKENSYSYDNIILWVSNNLKDVEILNHFDFIDAHEKNIRIRCTKCFREWDTCWNYLQTKRTCLSCKQKINGKNKRIPFNNVILEYSKNGYEVICDENDFVGVDYPILTKCKNCGNIWKSRYHSIISSKGGCPVCNESHGEKFVAKVLFENKIYFERQKRFPDCKRIKPLPFDFYLPDYNLLIEYNGEQHYIPIIYFGGENHLAKVKESDNIKIKYCQDNNIDLLIIPYWNKEIGDTIFERINLGGNKYE